ncbi:hypothetical protein QCM80_41540 [Bradyrhizobium sp. SSUT112]|nr:hypothetical protein [Bradyrhizobium sp. SSUT112]MDH2357030.1 hypothetical protein [Bradyrhizobium sp. SSUT112]
MPTPVVVMVEPDPVTVIVPVEPARSPAVTLTLLRAPPPEMVSAPVPD